MSWVFTTIIYVYHFRKHHEFCHSDQLMDDYKKCLFDPVDDMANSKRQLMFRNRKHEVNRDDDKRVVQKDGEALGSREFNFSKISSNGK